MAVPTSQTATLIVTEALKKTGRSSPTSDEITRATDYYLEEIKHDLAGRKDWHLVENTKVLIPDAFSHRIADPTDFEKMLDVRFYNGVVKGTAQTGSSSSITLAAAESLSEEQAKGSQIFVTGGTGKGSSSRGTTYSESTKAMGVSPNFTTAPAASSTYMVADTERSLSYIPHEEMRGINSTGEPTSISYYNGEFFLDPIPDVATYAIVAKYLMRVDQIDLTDTVYTTLLNKWRVALVEGVYMKQLQEDSDNRYQAAVQTYETSVLRLMQKDGRQRRQRNQSFIRRTGGLPV